MKKLAITIFFLSLGTQAFTLNPPEPTATVQAYARTFVDNVKMYRQASTATEILKSLKCTDELIVVRPHNPTWTIVVIDDLAGYVLTSEINWKSSYRQAVFARQ